MSHLETHLLSATRDDAAGEAFDKGARLLGLPYPGGPALAQLAARGDAAFYRFPRPLSGTDTMDFSFSGLKTALKYYLRDHGGSDNLSPQERSGIAASYQKAIIDHLLSRIEKALDQQDGIQEVHVVGGVAANQYLRKVFSKLPCSVRYPAKIEFCTDNAAMIAAAGYFMVQELGTSAFKAFPTLAADSL